MAPVILSMDVHCDSCAKKIRKAVMKVPGAESVSASFETGLVVVEGTADAAALRAHLQAKTKKNVNVVSDGTHAGEDSGAAGTNAATAGGSSSSPLSSPAPDPAPAAAPIVLEMELHCRSCADKVERRVMEIPGTQQGASCTFFFCTRTFACWSISFAYCLIGTCTCCTCVRAGVVTVRTDVAGRRVEVTGTADASAVATSLEVRMRKPVRVVSDPRSAGAAGYEHERRKAAAARAAAQQIQEMYSGTSSSYGAPPPQAGYYYNNYPEPGGGVCGQAGQQWPAYPSPGMESEMEGYYPYGGQQDDEKPPGCSIQ
ncbi:hypothetical protein HU200_022073 [Digitaria exilis]|uniref:HMA domain-containing protein n=1 Tax=Digitaria exilis TaxID=1010633 RepID=A0A835EY53_9POAL|nr:hypothetical protein HU200_022073 [Digitaria exilis]